MPEQKCGDFGSFKYRVPNIADYLEMLGASGVTASNLENPDELNDLVLTARMLKSARMLVQEISVKVNKKKLETYDDLLAERQLMPFLLEFVGKVQSGFNEADSVKK